MARIIFLLFSLLSSAIVNGQDTAFDKKVERLFFNVNVSSRPISLVDSFAKTKTLTYKKPQGYTEYLMLGKVWWHSFTFKKLPQFQTDFKIGKIDIEVNDDGSGKKVGEIWWSLEFDKKEKAQKLFKELEKYLKVAGGISKTYQSEFGDRTAEFSNKASKKYPYLMLSLSDNDNPEKRYKIVLMLDNDMH